jgi:hypothetical protein
MDNVIPFASELRLKPGQAQWHSTEPDGGPDVGIMVGIDATRQLWVGEIPRATWEEFAPESHVLGADDGWWIVLYSPDGKELIGKALDSETAISLAETIAAALRGEAHAS